MTVSVLIVDDQALVRAGFRSLLETEPEIRVVGEAADGVAAVEAALRLDPDVVLMDIRMPRSDGLQATRELARAGCRSRVLVLTTFDLDEYIFGALRAGASGFMLKDAEAEHLIAGILLVAAGEALLAPRVTRRVIEEFARLPASPGPGTAPDILTPREAEVLTLIARGLSNAEIAALLTVSETTTKTHVAHILLKLDLRDRVQAVVYAYECGLVRAGTQGR